MEKKKRVRGLTITVVAILVVCLAAMLFVTFKPLVALFTTKSDHFATFATFGEIFSKGLGQYFATIFGGFSFNAQLISFAVIALLALVAIIILVIACAKRKAWKYFPHLIVILLIAFGLLLNAAMLTYPDYMAGGKGFVEQLFVADSPVLKLLTFKESNIAVFILTVVWLLAAILLLVFGIIYFIRLIAVIRQVPATKKVEEVKEEKKAEPEKVSEPEEEKEEPKKKKVVLVVKRYDAVQPTGPVVERPVDYPRHQIEVTPLTKEDVREILREELDAREEKAEKACEPVEAVAEAKEEKEEATVPTPVIITIPEPLREQKEEKKAPAKPQLSKEEIRDIIREELVKALEGLKTAEPEVIEEVVEEVVEAPVVEEPKEEPAPEVKEEPVVEETETVAELNENDVAVDVEAPVAEKAPAPERISFAERIQTADDELKDDYNQIKSLLISYGLKSRVSNGGDSFRLHKVNYCKITVAGKSLKLYLALNPEDYKNSTIPVKDASSKAMYKDMPLVFKVKSGLSLRRAEQLITEMMDKHSVEQVDRVEVKDYASHFEESEESDE